MDPSIIDDEAAEPQTVNDLLDWIEKNDPEARRQLLVHMADLAERHRCLGYKQAQHDMLRAIVDLRIPDPNTRSNRTDVL